jgi:hypothetical protein
MARAYSETATSVVVGLFGAKLKTVASISILQVVMVVTGMGALGRPSVALGEMPAMLKR